MNHDVVYNEQILSIAQNAPLYVTTVLACQNTLIRSGISHILSGTQFVISDAPRNKHQSCRSSASFTPTK